MSYGICSKSIKKVLLDEATNDFIESYSYGIFHVMLMFIESMS